MTAARGASGAVDVRYEQMTEDPDEVAAVIARKLGAPPGPLAAALRAAHASSVGRYRTDLTPEQLAEVEDEAGDLLRELGYVSSASA